MRRFRPRRGRLAALALLPLAALTTTTIPDAASAADPRLRVSDRSVHFGDSVTLRGTFADAPGAAVELRHRAKGSQSWRVVRRARTGADGGYAVRVKPRRIGFWRAALAGDSWTQSTDAAGTVGARESGETRIVVRSRTRAKVTGRHATVGDRVKVRGKVTPAGAERRIVVRVGGSKTTTRAGANGRFAIRWRAPSTGKYGVRVSARSNRLAKGSRERAGKVTVYRPAPASWYGPGFYGNRTACGGTLGTSTLGVAHKTMPCGTRLRLRYHGRTVAVRVIDRGPFAGDREFDLTEATKRKLGFPDTGTVLTSK